MSNRDKRARLLTIAEHQGWICALCGLPMSKDTVTRDHVIPRSWGRLVHNNTLAAHKRCNKDRQAAAPTGCQLIWLCAVSARRVQLLAKYDGHDGARVTTKFQQIEDERFAELMAAMKPRVVIERKPAKKIRAKRPERPTHDGFGPPVWPSNSNAGNVTPGDGFAQSV